ncbi:MAG: hypothetical protein L0215_12365 [Gemmataceae bacterium]|nr:hypothetical protein [Gemmataceae bacterium]
MNMFLLVLVGSGVIVIFARQCWLRLRSTEEEAYYFTRCQACQQKVRYAAANAGGKGMCPRCLRPLYLPETSQPLSRPLSPHRVGERLLQKT